MIFDFFKSNRSSFKIGDETIIKREYVGKYHNIDRSSILKIEQVNKNDAVVVYVDPNVNDICRNNMPISALYKVDE